MSERLRAVLFGLAVGVGPLLLLDLGATLREAIARDPASTSVWWPVACYIATGAVVAVGLALGRRARIVPAVAAAVVLVVALPAVSSGATGWLSRLALPVADDATSSAALFVAAGAYLYAAVCGAKA